MTVADLTSKIRAQLIINSYEKWLPKKQKVLDIGCGTAVVADEIRKILNVSVSGCDIDQYLLRNIPFRKMKSPTRLPYKQNSFDFAMLNDVLHHTNYGNQEKLLKEALRVANKALIFELTPTLLGKISDFIINKLHHPSMPIPYTYRKIGKWKKLFTRMGLKFETKSVQKPFFYPFNHVAFKITNK